ICKSIEPQVCRTLSFPALSTGVMFRFSIQAMATSAALSHYCNLLMNMSGLQVQVGWTRACGTIARVRREQELEDFRNQIVIVGFRNLAAIEFASFGNQTIRHIGNVKLAINFRRVHCAASFEEQIALFRGTFEDYIEFPASQVFLLSPADLFLDLHHVLAPALDLARRNFFVQRECSGTLLVRIGKSSHPVELGFFHE